MATLDQVIQQIRFGFGQLSCLNGHHEFEHLCRHLARERICSNILPATGPVSVGGDQGRDFETFRTYLRGNLLGTSAFVGLAADRPIAFACTLQKDVGRKLKSDVTTISSGTPRIEEVHFFCVAEVPVVTRHDLQKWALDGLGIHLEIHDGQSISELLAARDVFWIAQKYLSIPSEIYPPTATSENENWYQAAWTKWRSVSPRPHSFADFSEIKTAARFAAKSDHVRQDLPMWLHLLEAYVDQAGSRLLHRRALYEHATASLIGLGMMTGQEERLRKYFSTVPELDDPVDLEDSQALLNFCVGAASENRVQLSCSELGEWGRALCNRVQELLVQASTPGTKCSLLELRGLIALSPDPENPQPPETGVALAYWRDLIAIVPSAPLFPLERLSDRLVKLVDIIGDDQAYDSLVQAVDELLAERSGGFVAAQKSKDRALAFHRRGQVLRAINQLHHAKVNWFADETLRGSVLAIMCISRWYLELGLSFAAKYYALAATYVSVHARSMALKDLLHHGLFQTAECDYFHGSWGGYLDFVDLGLRAQGLFAKSDDDYFENLVFNGSIMRAISKATQPELGQLVEERVKAWNMEPYIAQLLPSAMRTWGKAESLEAFWSRAQEQAGGPPFSDIGDNRSIRWAALGIDWTIECKNTYTDAPYAEQFVSTLQILLGDMAGLDLCLLPSSVKLRVEVADVSETKVTSIPSNALSEWRVQVPVNPSDDFRDVAAVATHVLAHVSVLPRKEFFKLLEDRFKDGLATKIFVAKPYVALYSEFISSDQFNTPIRNHRRPLALNRPFSPRCHQELKWIDDPGPGYSAASAREAIKNRYDRAPVPIRFTLQRLRQIPSFQETVRSLRRAGWLDWHLLMAIASITVNYRAATLAPTLTPEFGMILNRLMNQPEQRSTTPVPLSEYHEDKLRMHLHMSMLSTLRNLGLAPRQETPDFQAISKFLGARYGYWTDDTEHPDPFPEAASK